MKWIAKFIFTKILGWKLIGDFHPTIKKYILIGAPHTSMRDFFISLLTRTMKEASINVITKKSFFKFPLKYIMRALGAIPVDRTKSNNLVEAIVKMFEEREVFRLAISPEGTRSRVEKWKTGFYYIAKGANVPVVMYTFDFGKKQVEISEPYYLTDNIEKDFEHFLNFYKDIKGAKPEQFNNQKIF